jgi:Sucrase/ferredoxin-like
MMLSASNIPLPHDELDPYRNPTRVLLLPAFVWVENVTHNNVDQLITHIVNAAPTTTTPFEAPLASATRTTSNGTTALSSKSYEDSAGALSNGDDTSAPIMPTLSNGHASSHSKDPSTLSIPSSLPFTTKPVGHSALILLCSQGTRDARCGQSAPLLRREFERHLRPLGLYRDVHDERPGGVGIYFISHTGGHKFSANVIVYRRKSMDRWTTKLHGSTNTTVKPDAEVEDDDSWGAAQCIWLARVKPNECEGVVKYTVLQGKVVKPEWQLRGGFDRCRKLVSW